MRLFSACAVSQSLKNRRCIIHSGICTYVLPDFRHISLYKVCIACFNSIFFQRPLRFACVHYYSVVGAWAYATCAHCHHIEWQIKAYYTFVAQQSHHKLKIGCYGIIILVGSINVKQFATTVEWRVRWSIAIAQHRSAEILARIIADYAVGIVASHNTHRHRPNPLP